METYRGFGTSVPPSPIDSNWYRGLFESSSEALIALSLEGKILAFNRSAEQMFGYQKEEVLGKSVFHLVPLGRGGLLQQKLQTVKDGGKIEAYETTRLRKDGTRFPVSLMMSPIKNDSDRLIGVTWTLRHPTDREKQEALVKKLSCVVEQIADPVMITDRLGIVEYINPAFTAVTGYTAAETIGRSSRLLKSGKHPASFYRELWHTILEGRVFRGTLINRKKNGDFFVTEKTITPICINAEEITHFVSTDKIMPRETLN